MRTLSATLKAAQESNNRSPYPKLVLTSGGTTYTYYGGKGGRIIKFDHPEQQNSHITTVTLLNADHALDALDLKGYTAVLSEGFNTSAGPEYSAHAPQKVRDMSFSSNPGRLFCHLYLIGIPDLLKEDSALLDYSHSQYSVKTVKGLYTEIMSGSAVSEELPVQQLTSDNYLNLDDTNDGAGEKLVISATVTKISFKLKKSGSPTGDITFKIDSVASGATLAEKVLADASTLTTSGVWYEATLTTPVAIDEEVYLYCIFSGGDVANYVLVAFQTSQLSSEHHMVVIPDAGDLYDLNNYTCAYKYKYTYAGISVFSHCTAYDVVYDSEDSLIDTYCPADSFSIKEGEDRLSVGDRLLYHTGCERRFEDDGKIHVFVPTISGTTYDSEYSLASGHKFFSKQKNDGLIIPNKIIVRSPLDALPAYEGDATSATSFALLPVSRLVRTVLESDAQGDAMAAAIISRLEVAQQQGSAVTPVNCGAELFDYVKITDARASDTKTGNFGTLTFTYRSGYGGTQPIYNMSFSFGRIPIKSVPGARASRMANLLSNLRSEDNSIPWEELYAFLQELADNVHDIDVALGFIEAETPADEVVAESLIGYLKNLVEDTTPQLGGNLDVNSKNISGIKIDQQDETGARALGTVYQNTNYPRLVCATILTGVGGGATAYAELDDATPDIEVAYVYSPATNDYVQIVFMVQPNAYYKIVAVNGDEAKYKWVEWRIGYKA
jgi:hypothetical protein